MAINRLDTLMLLRDASIKRLSASKDHMERGFATDFLSQIGSSREPRYLARMASVGRYRSKHQTWAWQSTKPLPLGLALLLIGYADSGKPGGSGRYWINLTNDNTNKMIFVLLLWDWLKLNPWLEAMAKNRTLALQCNHRLSYWRGWRKIITIMWNSFPDLYDEYMRQRYVMQGFWSRRMR